MRGGWVVDYASLPLQCLTPFLLIKKKLLSFLLKVLATRPKLCLTTALHTHSLHSSLLKPWLTKCWTPVAHQKALSVLLEISKPSHTSGALLDTWWVAGVAPHPPEIILVFKVRVCLLPESYPGLLTSRLTQVSFGFSWNTTDKNIHFILSEITAVSVYFCWPVLLFCATF